jgi:Flp pilus assembly protein TadD
MNASAIEALNQAALLSPNDPKIYYNLAILHGRQMENQEAISLLEKAITLKTNYREAYYALYIFYLELNNKEKAQEVLEQYLASVDATDQQFLEILGKTK